MGNLERIGKEFDMMQPFRNAAQHSIEQDPPRKGDFEKNGILYCGVCKTPKRELVDFGGESILWATPCKCELDRIHKEEERKKREERLKQIQALKAVSLMDENAKKSHFSDFVETPHNRKNLKIGKRYCERFEEMLEKNQGLLFYGSVGTSKSFLAECIANCLMEEKLYSVMVMSLTRLIDKLGPFGDENISIDAIKQADLWVLDDLGAERSTDYGYEKAYEIVDTRYRQRKPIIVTTNLSLEEMQGETDLRKQRIYDRIFEICYPMAFTGPSWRKKEAGRRFEEMRKFLED